MRLSIQDSSVNWQQKALWALRERISPFIFIEEGQKEVVNQHTLELGIYVQDAILDRNDGLTIKYIELPSIASYHVTLKGHRFAIEGPSKVEVIRLAQDRYHNIVDRAHQALLPSVFQEIVMIEEVAVYLRPLEKILRRVEENGSITRNYLKKPPAKINQYFTLLKNLNYIRSEGELFVEGRAMEELKGAHLRSTSLYKRILAHVVEAGSKYIHDVMRLPLINTYLQWANAYYFPAYRIGKLINVKQEDYFGEYTRLYGAPREPAQVNRLEEVNLIMRTDDNFGIFYMGDQNKFEDFRERADQQNILAPMVAG